MLPRLPSRPEALMQRVVTTAIEERLDRLPPAAMRRIGTGQTLVVVGNGMVSHRLCRQLVSLGATARYDVVVFGEEPQPAYDRVHLTDYFSGRDENALLLAPEDWYRSHGIELHLGDPVVQIDRDAQTVTSAGGMEVSYTHLVLATGSSPYVPPIDGAALSGVFVYRTLADLAAIQARARQSSAAAVIGGGLLGLEAARALQRLALRIHVIEAAAAIMPAQLDQKAGKLLEERIRALDIDVRTSAITRRIESNGRRRTLHFAGGDSLTVDMVVIATGIRPRTELARGCDLARSLEGGVIVDDRLRTSDPNIFAIGECASHRAQIHGLAAPGYAMADALASHLIGRRTTFTPPVPVTRLKLLGVDVVSAGEPLDRGQTVRARAGDGYRLLRIERGRLVGALGVGAWKEFSRIQDATLRRRLVWPWQISRFERTGNLWPSQGAVPVSEWATDAVICNCMTVTRGQLAAAAAGQPTVTVQSLIECTGASTLCGSCRPLLEELVGAQDRQPGRVGRTLLGGSLVALAAAAILLAASPVPFAETVQEPWSVDRLWRDGAYRQISGFALLGLSALASLLSVRKRWRVAALAGPFPVWRMVHVVLGVLTLGALAVHTGARTGDNLNFALMASFSAVNIIGGLAGGFTAIEQKLGTAAGRRFRSALVVAHVLAVWPLPVLITFHVLSVYYF
jgi:nitrite reductase (NADH) large subunit